MSEWTKERHNWARQFVQSCDKDHRNTDHDTRAACDYLRDALKEIELLFKANQAAVKLRTIDLTEIQENTKEIERLQRDNKIMLSELEYVRDWCQQDDWELDGERIIRALAKVDAVNERKDNENNDSDNIHRTGSAVDQRDGSGHDQPQAD